LLNGAAARTGREPSAPPAPPGHRNPEALREGAPHHERADRRDLATRDFPTLRRSIYEDEGTGPVSLTTWGVQSVVGEGEAA